MAAQNTPLRSSIGDVIADTAGTTVGVVRLAPEKSYPGLPELLRRFINDDSKEAWDAIKARVDYTCESVDYALSPLVAEGLRDRLDAELAKGKKLVFKPNLVNPMAIETADHGEGIGYATCTAWPVIAAVMRWFHDKLDVSYHQMALAEAATVVDAAAGRYNLLNNRSDITREAVMEGRFAGDVYGGWGFYFVRRYLAETHDASHSDDPMKGYEDSLSGNYVPPGRAMDRLPVYDLNAARGDRGREVKVPEGANFSSIVLHKVIVGGEPGNAADQRDYPGCVLVNAPKMKAHDIALFTNVIKNLGIGLYPMDAPANDGRDDWRYAYPHKSIPGMKALIPHEVWVPEMDGDSPLPKRDERGDFIVRKTAGMPGTMADVIAAALSQGVFVINVVDAIEVTNLTNTDGVIGLKVPEGMFFAGTDVLATDLACARYMFKTVPVAEARRLQAERGLPSDFLQRQPLPAVEGSNIVATEGIDSPISRYKAFAYMEKRGIGRQEYHVAGRDLVAGQHLVSVDGHLGRAAGGEFVEVITETMYFAVSKPLWDLQTMVMAYAEANDKLTGSNVKQQFLDAFDENGDGVIDYDETGRNGVISGPMLGSGGLLVNTIGSEIYGALRARFQMRAQSLRWSTRAYNTEGLDILDPFMYNAVSVLGLMMSQLELEGADPFVPGLTWGKGKWPSLQLARFLAVGAAIYGQEYPLALNAQSLYGAVFQYADRVYNGGHHVGDSRLMGDSIVIDTAPLNGYVKRVSEGAEALPFVFYVPMGYADCAGSRVPNVQETDDPALLLRAVFADGKEVW